MFRLGFCLSRSLLYTSRDGYENVAYEFLCGIWPVMILGMLGKNF